MFSNVCENLKPDFYELVVVENEGAKVACSCTLANETGGEYLIWRECQKDQKPDF